MADDLAILRPAAEERALPERLRRQRIEPERGEEPLSRALTICSGSYFFARSSSASTSSEPGRGTAPHEPVDVRPLLRPHVAEEVRRDRGLLGDLVLAVLRAELRPRALAVKRLVVERLHLCPRGARCPPRTPAGSCRNRLARARRRPGGLQLRRPLVAEGDVTARTSAGVAGMIACQPVSCIRRAARPSRGWLLPAEVGELVEREALRLGPGACAATLPGLPRSIASPWPGLRAVLFPCRTGSSSRPGRARRRARRRAGSLGAGKGGRDLGGAPAGEATSAGNCELDRSAPPPSIVPAVQVVRHARALGGGGERASVSSVKVRLGDQDARADCGSAARCNSRSTAATKACASAGPERRRLRGRPPAGPPRAPGYRAPSSPWRGGAGAAVGQERRRCTPRPARARRASADAMAASIRARAKRTPTGPPSTAGPCRGTRSDVPQLGAAPQPPPPSGFTPAQLPPRVTRTGRDSPVPSAIPAGRRDLDEPPRSDGSPAAANCSYNAHPVKYPRTPGPTRSLDVGPSAPRTATRHRHPRSPPGPDAGGHLQPGSRPRRCPHCTRPAQRRRPGYDLSGEGARAGAPPRGTGPHGSCTQAGAPAMVGSGACVRDPGRARHRSLAYPRALSVGKLARRLGYGLSMVSLASARRRAAAVGLIRLHLRSPTSRTSRGDGPPRRRSSAGAPPDPRSRGGRRRAHGVVLACRLVSLGGSARGHRQVRRMQPGIHRRPRAQGVDVSGVRTVLPPGRAHATGERGFRPPFLAPTSARARYSQRIVRVARATQASG